MIETTPAVSSLVLAGGWSTRVRGRNEATGRRPAVAVRTAEQRRTDDGVLSTPVDVAFDLPVVTAPLAGLFGALDTVRTPYVRSRARRAPAVRSRRGVARSPVSGSRQVGRSPRGAVPPSVPLYRPMTNVHTRDELAAVALSRSDQ